MKNANENTTIRSTSIIREELETACGNYSASRIKHDNAIEQGKSISAKLLKELADYNATCDKLVSEYKTSARNEFYEKCRDTKNPVRTALTIYEYETLNTVDEPVSKENPVFAKRSIVSKKAVVNIYDFEKYLGIDSSVIATQKGWVNKLGRELTVRVSKALGCEESVVSEMADEIKSAADLEFTKKAKGDKRTALLIAIQNVVDAIYYEADKKTKENILSCDSTDEAYLEYCFTRKGRERLSVKVLKDGGLVYVITDMMHKALTNSSYTVGGYRTK